MPELRLNIITRDWVIIAKERSKRPDQFILKKTGTPPLPMHDPSCPFCPGNESQTQGEKFRIGNSGSAWKVRVFPNKFPALSEEGERVRAKQDIYHSMTGVGYHEVIAEHPRHNLTLATMSDDDVAEILRAYLQRYTTLRKDPRIEAIILFKNHGEAAGSSIIHPHSQLAATPVVPYQFRARIEEAMRFLDETGECVFCHMLADELSGGERVILETRHFVTFNPYASLSPFHTWIFPKRHASSFDAITPEELSDLASHLRTVLAKLYHGLNDPPYNFAIRSIPTDDQNSDYYHWYLTIIPRVTKSAGFEFGSGMFINPSLPEESAAFLRNVNPHRS